jgi:hypothetical protein
VYVYNTGYKKEGSRGLVSLAFVTHSTRVFNIKFIEIGISPNPDRPMLPVFGHRFPCGFTGLVLRFYPRFFLGRRSVACQN